MTVEYHVYANDGAGGPVDYSTVVATVSALTYTPAALAPSSDTTFAVRAFDTVSGLEEQGTAARARIVIDGSGNNITGMPVAPASLTVSPGAASSARVSWTYTPVAGAGTPTGFHVYAGTPTPSYGTPAATVPYTRGRAGFSATLTGLTPGSAYQVVVRSYNAVGEDANTNAASFTASSTGPAPVDSLSIS